jgi:hypothetical protein
MVVARGFGCGGGGDDGGNACRIPEEPARGGELRGHLSRLPGHLRQLLLKPRISAQASSLRMRVRIETKRGTRRMPAGAISQQVVTPRQTVTGGVRNGLRTRACVHAGCEVRFDGRQSHGGRGVKKSFESGGGVAEKSTHLITPAAQPAALPVCSLEPEDSRLHPASLAVVHSPGCWSSMPRYASFSSPRRRRLP